MYNYSTILDRPCFKDPTDHQPACALFPHDNGYMHWGAKLHSCRAPKELSAGSCEHLFEVHRGLLLLDQVRAHEYSDLQETPTLTWGQLKIVDIVEGKTIIIFRANNTYWTHPISINLTNYLPTFPLLMYPLCCCDTSVCQWPSELLGTSSLLFF